ncbi:hypothetical protein B0H12DRAFT_1103047, partial [Mycena haematopus]
LGRIRIHATPTPTRSALLFEQPHASCARCSTMDSRKDCLAMPRRASHRPNLEIPAVPPLDKPIRVNAREGDPGLSSHLTWFINLTQVVTALEDHYIDDSVELDEDPAFAAQVVRHKLWKEVKGFLPGLNDIRAEEFHWGEQSIEQYTEYLLPFHFDN